MRLSRLLTNDSRVEPLTLSITPLPFMNGHEVRINGCLVGFRPDDGSGWQEVADEVTGALADLLGEKLGYSKEYPVSEEGF